MKTKHYFLLQGLLLLCAHFLPAQTNVSSVFQSLTKEELSSFNLETDFQALQDNRKTDQPFPAVLHAAG